MPYPLYMQALKVTLSDLRCDVEREQGLGSTFFGGTHKLNSVYVKERNSTMYKSPARNPSTLLVPFKPCIKTVKWYVRRPH